MWAFTQTLNKYIASGKGIPQTLRGSLACIKREREEKRDAQIERGNPFPDPVYLSLPVTRKYDTSTPKSIWLAEGCAIHAGRFSFTSGGLKRENNGRNKRSVILETFDNETLCQPS